MVTHTDLMSHDRDCQSTVRHCHNAQRSSSCPFNICLLPKSSIHFLCGFGSHIQLSFSLIIYHASLRQRKKGSGSSQHRFLILHFHHISDHHHHTISFNLYCCYHENRGFNHQTPHLYSTWTGFRFPKATCNSAFILYLTFYYFADYYIAFINVHFITMVWAHFGQWSGPTCNHLDSSAAWVLRHRHLVSLLFILNCVK